ncbi:LysE family translocator [Pseudomonas putida CSV86]|uniref:LysE family translocator n=1 Tax=Pseudomonas bharatica CSV86 TaxID=1005395 RepID=L1LSK0_9PSED|nr:MULTISPECIES: LysE family translocator [Pseudomonas]MDG9882415.1 LysE family translocator [Pseudomonas sp. GD04058]NNJ15860.1 LysE family translocator [Pseudomonas bharatica CSV86]
MNTTLLIAYLGTIVLLIATPGPVVLLVVDAASRSGTASAIRTALGANAASLVLVAAAAGVLAGALALSPQLLQWGALAGCLFIGWLGFSGLRDCGAGESSPARKANGWCQGFLIGISNPKDILFFVALFPQFIPVTGSFGTSIGLLALLWLLVDLGILALYIGLMRHALAQRYRAWVSRVSAWMLLLLATAGAAYWGRVLLA